MIMLIVILAVMGFILSFVSNGVLKTADTSIGKSMLVIFGWGAAMFGVNHILDDSGLHPAIIAISSLAASVLILSGILMAAFQATFKQAALIAAIFAAVMFLIGLGLAACTPS